MDRLQTELQRLAFALDGDPSRPTRALVLELVQPLPWNAVARAWQGVQSELELPAPAIAVSGTDAYQLWFSLAEPVPAAQALAFLQGVRRRYLGDAVPERIRMSPAEPAGRPVDRVPPALAAPGQWSAFVATDLAGLFDQERWLDLAPSADAQADLLSRVQCARRADFVRALERLAPALDADATGRPTEPSGPHQDPRSFLLAVMNDRAVDLKLRIEAAKALLPATDRQRS